MGERTTPRDPGRPALAAAPHHLDGGGAVLLHRRMAALIHNVSVDLRQLAREPHTRTRTFRDLAVVSRVVHEQAVAIGVPADWIAHAKKAGQQGRRATEAVSLPPRRPVARSLLIAQLHHQVDTLATLAVVGPVRRDRAAVTVQASDKLAEHLRLQWLRVAIGRHCPGRHRGRNKRVVVARDGRLASPPGPDLAAVGTRSGASMARTHPRGPGPGRACPGRGDAHGRHRPRRQRTPCSKPPPKPPGTQPP